MTTLDITGTYKAPFAADQGPKKDHRMLAAIVETPDDGPYFFRLVGPKKTVQANAEAYKAMLKGAMLR